MEPLIALVGVTAVLQLAGRLGAHRLRHLPTDLRGGLAVMFLLTGGAHLVGLRGELVEMVPPWLPAPELLVTLTGFAELAGAVGLLWCRTATPAAAGLTLLMILMFPANVYAATSGLATAWYDQLVPRPSCRHLPGRLDHGSRGRVAPLRGSLPDPLADTGLAACHEFAGPPVGPHDVGLGLTGQRTHPSSLSATAPAGPYEG